MRLDLPLFTALLAVALPFAAHAQSKSDQAREQRWAAQVMSNLVVGEAIQLQAEGAKFLALHTTAGRAKGAVLLAHGPGLHPDHGITGELRVLLADRGYTTLSLQMPVAAAENEQPEDYQKLMPEAVQRIAAGVAFLRQQGATRIAIVSHAMGSGMTYAYLRRTPDAPLAAWVALSFYGEFPELAKVRFPVLDLYGSDDYRGIRGPARDRKQVLDGLPGSRQLAAPDGGRFLAGGEKTVLREVPAFLDGVFK
jgi:dienelactone hydrolase